MPSRGSHAANPDLRSFATKATKKDLRQTAAGIVIANAVLTAAIVFGALKLALAQ